MAYIFLDESGDLGFDFNKVKTSKYFVITFIFCNKKKDVEKAVTGTHKELKKKYKRMSGVLHAYKEKPITRSRLLNRLCEKNISIMYIYLNKHKVYSKLQNEKDFLYNYVTNILLDRIVTRKIIPTDKKVHLIASRKETNKFLNDNFKSYLTSKVNGEHKVDLVVEIKTPFEEKGLQAVDFVSWAIFRDLEHHDENYIKIIKNNIVEGNSLF